VTSSEPLLMWTVYDHPADYPDGYIARLFTVTEAGPVPTGHTMQGKGDFGLHLIRRFMERQGFACLHRNEEDPPQIMETWL
jgi:hypothetical protein